jgi:hypothetical protein
MKILLEPVMIWDDPRASQKAPPEDLQRLADFFYDALYAELKKDYEMVTNRNGEP